MISEKDIIRSHGTSREWLRKLRKGYSSRGYSYPPKLVFKIDYDYDADGNRLYTDSGLKKINEKTPT